MMFRRSRKSSLILSTALAGGLLAAGTAHGQTANGTLPNIGDATVVSGSATITGGGPGAGATLDVGLNTQRTVIDWFHFDVPAGATARFTNNAAVPLAAVLNRVRTGGPMATGGPSLLAGTITAPNVELWIQNGEGFIFGNGLSVNAGGFVASVPDLAVGDFTDGNNAFSLVAPVNSFGAITGGGTIRTNGGILALIAPRIDVDGTFDAGSGSTAFVTASDVTLATTPGSPLSLTINRGSAVSGNAQVVRGTVAGGDALFVLATQSSVVDAVLNIGASVTATGAVASGRGVTLVAGGTAAPVSGVTFAAGAGVSGGARIDSTGAITATGPGRPIAVRSIDFTSLTGALRSDSTIDINVGGALVLRSAAAAAGVRLRTPSAITASGAISTIDGTVDIVAGGALTLADLVSTAGVVSAVGSAVAARDIMAGDTVNVTASVGPIALRSVTAVGDVALTHSGAGAIGATGALRSTTGGLNVATTGAVSLGSVDVRTAAAVGIGTPAASILATGAVRAGTIDFRAAGTIDVATATATTGGLTMVTTGSSLRLGTGQSATSALITASNADVRIDSLGATNGTTTVDAASLRGLTGPGASLTASVGAVRAATSGNLALSNVTAGSTFDAISGGTLLIDGTATAGNAVVLTAAGRADVNSVTSTGSTIALNAGGAIVGIGALGGSLSAADALTISGGGASALGLARGSSVTATAPDITIGSSVATVGDVDVSASAGGVTLADVTAVRDVVVAATADAVVAGNVSAGRDYLVRGANVRVGDDADAEVQSAGRLARITATPGSISGGAALTLRGDALGAGIGNAVILDAASGTITLPGSIVQGGPARQSDVALRYLAGSPLVLGDIAARTFGLTTGAFGSVTPITSTAAVTLGNIDSSQAVALTTTGAPLTTGSIRTYDPAADVTLTATGADGSITTLDVESTGVVAITAAEDFAGRNVRSATGTTISGTSVAATGVRATTGNVGVTASAGRLSIDAVSGGDVDLRTTGGGAAGTLSVGTVDASGFATLDSVASVAFDRVTSVGDATIIAATNVNGRAGLRGDVDSTAGNASITAGGATTLGSVRGNSVGITAASVDAMTTAARTGSLTINATAAELNIGAASAPTGVTLTAAGPLTVGSVNTTAGSATLTSAGAVLLANTSSIVGGDLTITGSSVGLGVDADAETIAATGRVDVTARNGAIAGGNGLTLRSDSAGVGGRNLILDATGGGIAFAPSSIVQGGPAQQSAIGLRLGTAGSAASFGSLSARAIGTVDAAHVAITPIVLTGRFSATGPIASRESFGVDAGEGIALNTVTVTDPGAMIRLVSPLAIGATTLTAPGLIDVRSMTRTDVGTATAGTSLTLAATNGALTLGTGMAGTTATLTAGQALDVTTSVSGTAGVSATAGGAATIGTIRSTNGPVVVDAASMTVGTARAGTSLLLNARTGAITLDTGEAGTTGLPTGTATVTAVGDVSVNTTLTSVGDAIVSGANLRLRNVAASAGNVTATGTGAVTGILPEGRADLRAGGVASDVRVTAGGTARLGTVTAGNLVAVRAASIDAITVTANAGSVAPIDRMATAALDLEATGATGGSIALVSGSSGAAARLAATGDIAVTSGLASQGNARVTGANLTLATVTTTDGSIVATGSGTVSGITGVADGRAELIAGGANRTATVSAGGTARIGTVRADAAVAVTAAAIDATTAVANAGAGTLDLIATNGALTLVTGRAGAVGSTNPLATARLSATGDVTVTTLASGGNATIGGANLRLGSVAAANGNVATMTGGELTGIGAVGRANLSAGGTTGNVTATAGGLARLGTVGAGNVVTLRARSIDATSVTASGGAIAAADRPTTPALDLEATAGDLRLANGTSAAAARLVASGDVTFETGLASVGNATVTGTNLRLANITTSNGNIVATGSGEVTGVGANGRANLTAGDPTRSDNATNRVTVTAGGLARLGAVSARNIVGVRAATIDATSVAASVATIPVPNRAATVAIDLTATAGSVTLDTAQTDAAASVVATGGVVITDRLTSVGNATVTGSNLQLARVSASGGSVTATASGSVTGSNVATRADLSAGGMASNVTVTATAGTARLGTVSAGNVVSVRAASIDADAVTASAGSLLATRNTAIGLDLNATAGDLLLGMGDTSAAARLVASGGVTVGNRLNSFGNAEVTGNALQLANVNTTAGNIDVNGRASVTGIDPAGRANLNAGGTASTATVTAATLARLGTVSAAGGVRVTAATINATDVVARATAAATAGTIDLNATGGSLTLASGTAGSTATLRSTGALDVAAIDARGVTLSSGATLNAARVTSNGGVTATSTGAMTLGNITTTGTAAALTATSGGALSIGTASVTGAAMIDAVGAATLGAITAGPTLSVRASDAIVTGIQRATRVTFTNRIPATSALRLGDGTAGDGFRLSDAELKFVDADALVLDAGTGAVEVGTLAFGATAGRNTVDVLTTGRIDVRGTVSGSGVGRTFAFGGNVPGTTTLASDIIIAATPNAGGRLLFGNAELVLRGGRIAQGQTSGFLVPLAATPLADVGGRFVSNASSSLYRAIIGGTEYGTSAADQTILSANRLTVRFTDYALFQNTGGLGENRGAVISGANGAAPSLSFIGPGVDRGTVAIFGSVNGVENVATALLGPTEINTSLLDERAARVNGCLLGSGAGCLTNVVSQPALNVFDASRTRILRSEDNLSVPFDPVVSTNNEALFTGVSSIDVPPEDVVPVPENCPESSTEPCPPKQENLP